MSKIRINELARELEVKPGVIIDLLPELGVADKKTHSSSLDDDIALQLRRRITGEPEEPVQKPVPATLTAPPHAPPALESHPLESHPLESHPRVLHTQEAVNVAVRPEPPPAASGIISAKADDSPVAPPVTAVESQPAPVNPPRSSFPLRPPLASSQTGAVRPASPITTGTMPVVVSPPAATAHSAPPVPGNAAPAASPASSNVKGSAIPARPVPPSTRPGQILSGPRQPLPPAAGQAPGMGLSQSGVGQAGVGPSGLGPSPGSAGLSLGQPIAPPARRTLGSPQPGAPPSSPVPPAAMTIPGPPRPGFQASSVPSMPSLRAPVRPAPTIPGAGASPPLAGVGGNQPMRPQGARPGQPPAGMMTQPPPGGQHLAGQPSARPVVPPRPDMVARLARPPAASTPGLPRPGVPSARPASPVPGRPIYTGPVRPGQPLRPGPGGPRPGGPSGPGGPMRGRPMHPTSPLRAEPATLPADPGRRHATKPGARDPRRRDVDHEEGRIRPQSRRQESFQPPPIDRQITVAEGITVKELSEKLGIKGNLLVKRLVEKKIFATINQTLDVKLAEDLARDFGASTNKVSYEEETTHEIQQTEVDLDREKRPPVVTIMGHVDHGKTSLLDAIREANVAGGEAGGITQHIGAYHVEKNGKNIVFIDTPGHEAFTRMRARGSKVTDIVVLVVAADDGVMPQTLEAIDHARAAGVPIIVAINKIDKPGAQPERIKQQLADRNLLAEDWGGDVVMVGVSAKTKEGIDHLLEMILLVAELQDLKANPARPGMGNVLEAKLDKGRGPVATVLVRNGTLKVGDYFVCGAVFGRVRAMFGDNGQPVREVGPSMPAEVLGLESLPEVGDTLQVVTDTAKAKQIVIYRESKAREVAMSKTNRITLDQLHDQLKEGETKELNIILKTDVGGTAEVISDTLQKLSNEKVKIRVLHSGVGAITETDVLLASASNAIIVGFNVRPDRTAQSVAELEKVDIRLHSIIYELSDEIKKAMSGMLDPVFKQVYKGRAQVREVFRISKVGAVAGCHVDDGVIQRNCEVRLLRDNVLIHTGKIDALKRFKNDASEVKQGFECGISLVNFNDIKPGDVIEAFVTERVAAEALA